MDGTLLDSTSQVLPSSVEALKAALKLGVTVCLATGKARPAAMTAMQKVGLAGVSFPPAFHVFHPTDHNGYSLPSTYKLLTIVEVQLAFSGMRAAKLF